MCTRAVSPPPSYTNEPPLVRYSSHVAGVAASSNVNEEVKEISAAHGVDDVNSGGERAEERTALFEEPGYPSKITSQASSDRELFRKMSTYMRIYIALFTSSPTRASTSQLHTFVRCIWSFRTCVIADAGALFDVGGGIRFCQGVDSTMLQLGVGDADRETVSIDERLHGDNVANTMNHIHELDERTLSDAKKRPSYDPEL